MRSRKYSRGKKRGRYKGRSRVRKFITLPRGGYRL